MKIRFECLDELDYYDLLDAMDELGVEPESEDDDTFYVIVEIPTDIPSDLTTNFEGTMSELVEGEWVQVP